MMFGFCLCVICFLCALVVCWLDRKAELEDKKPENTTESNEEEKFRV